MSIFNEFFKKKNQYLLDLGLVLAQVLVEVLLHQFHFKSLVQILPQKQSLEITQYINFLPLDHLRLKVDLEILISSSSVVVEKEVVVEAGGGGGGGMRWVVNDPADPNFANTPTTPNYVGVSDGSYTVQVGRGGGKPGVSTPNSGETSFTSIDPTVSAGGGGNLNNSGNGYGAGGGGGNGDGGGQNNYGAGGPNGGAGGGKGTEGQGGGGGSGGDNSSPIGGGNAGRRLTPANSDSNMQNVVGGQAIRISPKIPWITNADGANDGYFSGGGAGSADRSTNSSYHNASFTGGQGYYPPSTNGTAGADGSGGGGGGANPGGDGVVYLAIYNG